MNLVRVVCRAALTAYVSTETGGDRYDSQASNMDSISCQSQWKAVSSDGEDSVELVLVQGDEVENKKALIIVFSLLDFNLFLLNQLYTVLQQNSYKNFYGPLSIKLVSTN